MCAVPVSLATIRVGRADRHDLQQAQRRQLDRRIRTMQVDGRDEGRALVALVGSADHDDAFEIAREQQAGQLRVARDTPALEPAGRLRTRQQNGEPRGPQSVIAQHPLCLRGLDGRRMQDRKRGRRRNAGAGQQGAHAVDRGCGARQAARGQRERPARPHAPAVADAAAGQPGQRDQAARVVAALQVDQQVVAARADAAQPCPDHAQALPARPRVDHQHALEARIVSEQTGRGRQRVEIDPRLRKRATDVLHDRAGQGHVAERAPLEDQDAADAAAIRECFHDGG